MPTSGKPYRFKGDHIVPGLTRLTQVGASGTWTPNFVDCGGAGAIHFNISSDVDGTFYLESSVDGVTATFSRPIPVDASVRNGSPHILRVINRFYRIRFENGAAATSTFYALTRLTKSDSTLITIGQNETFDARSDATLVRPASSYAEDAALGRISDRRAVVKFGNNADIDSLTTPEDVWSRGGVWSPPTAARVHDIASTDANDTAAGTGVRTLRLFGLTSWDADGETSEDITMDGTNNVSTSNSYVIIYRMRELTAGSNAAAVGTITATAQTDGTVTAEIPAGKNTSYMAIFAIPSTKKLLLYGGFVAVNDTGSQSILADLEINNTPDTDLDLYTTTEIIGVSTTGTSAYSRRWEPPVMVPGPAILKATVTSVANNNANVSAGLDGVVVAA